jgi:D-methionine transport system ATP-binding protein
MIEIRNVVKTFKTKEEDIHAVNGVSLNIEDGEIYGIIGYSGAGKSTLVRLINQLEKQSAGDVVIDGQKMQELSKKELREKRRKIGMIFQHFNLMWSRTVLENIELPLEFAGVPKKEREEKARQMVELVGLSGREDAYPSELSGGQKQRVGIARALANDPQILLSDEATSALDPDTTDQILELLKDINHKLGITIVMITHQMEVVQKICHRMAVMSDGRIVEEGTVKELFEHPKNEITKKFVQNIESDQTIEETIEDLKKKYPDGLLLRCSFTGNNSDHPIIAEAIRKVKFDVSIVAADITNTQIGPIGVTYLNLNHGTDQEYNVFVTFLTENDVKVEEL